MRWINLKSLCSRRNIHSIKLCNPNLKWQLLFQIGAGTTQCFSSRIAKHLRHERICHQQRFSYSCTLMILNKTDPSPTRWPHENDMKDVNYEPFCILYYAQFVSCLLRGLQNVNYRLINTDMNNMSPDLQCSKEQPMQRVSVDHAWSIWFNQQPSLKILVLAPRPNTSSWIKPHKQCHIPEAACRDHQDRSRFWMFRRRCFKNTPVQDGRNKLSTLVFCWRRSTADGRKPQTSRAFFQRIRSDHPF